MLMMPQQQTSHEQSPISLLVPLPRSLNAGTRTTRTQEVGGTRSGCRKRDGTMQIQGNRSHCALRYAVSRFSSHRLLNLLHSNSSQIRTRGERRGRICRRALRRRVESEREVLASLDANIQSLRARVLTSEPPQRSVSILVLAFT